MYLNLITFIDAISVNVTINLTHHNKQSYNNQNYYDQNDQEPDYINKFITDMIFVMLIIIGCVGMAYIIKCICVCICKSNSV